jgi:hypothetical protein
MIRTHRATRDEILSSRSVSDGRTTYAVSSRNVYYLVLGSDGSNGLYGISQHTGQIIHITPTGHIRRNGCPSVRIAFAEDTGDSAGTLEFPRKDSVGGYTSSVYTEHLLGLGA